MGEMRAPLLRLSGISRTFGTDVPIPALRDVDLQVDAGERIAVVGASGSGKTTLLNIIGCLDRPDAGWYWFEDVDVGRLDDRRRAGIRSRDIGFVFQSFHLLAYRTVLENVMLAEVYARTPWAGRSDRALAALAAVGLADRAEALPTRLSSGQRQRVAIARALVGRPRLLLCDEPTGNLDSRSTSGILDLLDGLQGDGLTIVMITHDTGVATWADRRVRIVDGRIDGSS